MANPPTLDEAQERGLLTDDSQGIHTFSNGDQWDSWSAPNCERCKFFDPAVAGKFRAFEAAAFMHCASPELARLFGWVQDVKWDEPNDHRHGWDAPESCSFFCDRKDDNDDDRPPVPDPDPNQLVLLADPTEDAAAIVNARIEEMSHV